MDWTQLDEGGWFAQTPLYRFTITPVPDTETLHSVLIEKDSGTVTRFAGNKVSLLKRDCEAFWKGIQDELYKQR